MSTIRIVFYGHKRPYLACMGEIVIFPLATQLNLGEQVFFSLYHSDLVLYLFDFLHSSLKWVRLLDQNDSKQILTTLSHLSIV